MKLYKVSVEYIMLVLAEDEDEAHDLATDHSVLDEVADCKWHAEAMKHGDALPDGWDEDAELWPEPAMTVREALARYGR